MPGDFHDLLPEFFYGFLAAAFRHAVEPLHHGQYCLISGQRWFSKIFSQPFLVGFNALPERMVLGYI